MLTMAHVLLLTCLCSITFVTAASESQYVSQAEFEEFKNDMLKLKNAYFEEKNKLSRLQVRFEKLEHDLTNKITIEKQKNIILQKKFRRAEKQIEGLRDIIVNGIKEKQYSHQEVYPNSVKYPQQYNLQDTDLISKTQQDRRTQDKIVQSKNINRIQKSQISLVRRDRHIDTRQTPGRVAFQVNGLHDYKNLGYHQTLIFKDVKTNVGNCYHNNTGIFVCNVPGVYVFFTTLISENNHLVHTTIVKNGEILGVTYAHGTNGFYVTSSTMVITHVSSGESVWVRIEENSPSGLNLGDPENTFSGFLLYPDQ